MKLMMALLAKLNIPRDPLGIVLIAWKVAIIIAMIITSIFSYLAAMAAESAKCAGMFWIADYRSESSDFWALPLMSLAAVLIIALGAYKAKVLELLKDYQEPVIQFGPMRITFAERISYGIVLMSLIILWGVTAWAILRYSAIVHYCGSASALR